MAKKRGGGEGTISKRKDGRWAAAITLGYDNEGRQKRKFFYGDTRTEVAEKLREALNNQSTGMVVDSKKLTVEQWLKTWIDEYKKPSVRQTTYEYYCYVIDNYICNKDGIGYIRLMDLRPDHLQKLYNSTSIAGYSAVTIKNMHIVMKSALRQAIINRLIVHNVSEGTTRPKMVKKESRVFTPEEQKQFMDTLIDEKYGLLYRFALATGLRIGELMALRWKDIDQKEGYFEVKQALVRVKNSNPEINSKTILIFQEPKTEAGKRIVPIPKNIMPQLEKHQTKQKEYKLQSYGLYKEDIDLVFCNKLGGPMEPSNIRSRLYKLTEQAGIDHAGMHALRHSYATRLLEADESGKVVQELLGHSSIATTLDIYGHVMPEKKKQSAERINHLFS